MSEMIYPAECYAIRGACFNVYRELGTGFLEEVYHQALKLEFEALNIPFASKQPLTIYYRGVPLPTQYEPDFVCYGKIILEIKAAKNLIPEFQAQTINYLRATRLRMALLVNFHHLSEKNIIPLFNPSFQQEQ